MNGERYSVYLGMGQLNDPYVFGRIELGDRGNTEGYQVYAFVRVNG